MKIFLDTAQIEEVKKWVPSGLIDGITTNPTHVSKTHGDTTKLFKELCSLVAGDVSIEVVEKKPSAVYEQAKKIAAIAPNAVVKIPFDETFLPVIKQLVNEGVALNITLVFTMLQALMVAKLGVRYISPFIGRLDDIDSYGLELIEDIRTMLDNYDLSSQLLAASIRSVAHVHAVALIGADAATIPTSIFEKMMFHPLSAAGIAEFDADWSSTHKKSLLE